MAIEELLTDCAGTEFAYDPAAAYRIVVEHEPQTDLEKQIARAARVLLRAEGKHPEKRRVYNSLKTVQSMEEFKSVVAESTLSQAVKQRLMETLMQ